ncbi:MULTISPECIES: FAD/NAD(P)-binding protein [Burkholderia]|nr:MULTISPECIES: FAD/NAD(P)-binding protein [Burkholderia]EKS9794808.1 FAD/NAD(P)-binding protein [Burkholderia cepacia]EKS9802763.1 FAD/NAD(P)-binding protein [Burkholderia cepacia]EKS9809270.1 FAD/NAD(P)-binding protein [Burkholderia cepacia]EKS9818131.1 FAD/NAD(P)-binding protein [Burkholderia cepacia]EKS9824125.1 FAD/NAD(P)-binding protein [Burkholderia cepacia]
MREPCDIALVGCGAVGASFLARLEVDAGGFVGSVVIVDPAEEPGRGIAYGRDANSNLLNRANAAISVRADDLGEFFRWFAEERAAGRLEPQHANVPLEADGYAPRPLFGDYLVSRVRRTLAALAALGWRVRKERGMVIDINEESGSYRVTVSNGASFVARSVVLATGNGPSSAFRRFEGQEGYVALPYPNEGLSRRIGADAPVALLGSRLSAVDTAIALTDQGHRGPVFLASRTGQLPMVGGGNGNHVLAPATLEVARYARHAGPGSVSLVRLMRLMLREMARAEGRRLPVRSITRPELSPTQAFLACVEEREANVRKPWQDALIPFNDFVADFWNALPDDDRRRLMRGAYGAYMGYRVSIPLENGRKVAGLLRAGRVTNLWPLKEVTHDGEAFVLRFGTGGPTLAPDLRVPVLVNCTGLVGGPDASAGPLYPSLIAGGLARRHPFGGIDVDPHTNRVIGAHGSAHGLFAIGNSTQGVFLLTSNLVLNAAHAARVADLLLADLASAAAPSSRATNACSNGAQNVAL